MKLATLIETMDAKQAGMLKELQAVLAQHGNVDVYHGDMIPVEAGHLDDLLDIDMVTNPVELEKYPQGYLHLGQW